MNEIHDMAAAYALGSLDDEDRSDFERHLPTCADCQEQVGAMTDATGELAWEQAARPPDRLREAVMASLDSTPQEEVPGREPATVTRLVRRRRWIPLGIAAAIAALSLLGWSLLGSGRVLSAILADPNAVSIQAAPTDAGQGAFSSARFVYSRERAAGVFVIEGLKPAGSDRTYELWLIGETGPLPAGLFTPDESGRAEVLVKSEVQPGTVVALTEEPAGGVDAPTGDPLLTAEITS